MRGAFFEKMAFWKRRKAAMGWSKRILLGGVLGSLIGLGWLELPQAKAYWRSCGFGGVPVWSCGYECCWDGWYLGLRRGPLRRLLFGRYRWYYGGPVCYYTACYVPVCTLCGTAPCACWDLCATAPVVSTPVVTAPSEAPSTAPEAPSLPKPVLPTPKPAEPQSPAKPVPGPESPSPTPAPSMPGPSQSYFPTRSDSGLLTVYVPYDAKVFINGLQTRSQGSRRQYVSYGLLPGYRYKYEIRVEIVREGKILEESKVVYLTAGAKEAVAFGFNLGVAEGLAAAP